MAKPRILFVDDDTNILMGFQRTLRKEYAVETAIGPLEGLRAINDKGPFAVVVADLRMPKMNGVEFLTRVKDLFPDSVRIMLTGHGDLSVAMEAINSGNVFRFLLKPSSPGEMNNALQAGVEQYRLITSEKEIMQKTVTGIIDVLTDVLGFTNEVAMGRARRIMRFVRDIAVLLGETDVWFYETGAMLSQVGCVILPDSILKKMETGEKLEGEELQLFNQHPFMAFDLINKIPRLEGLAKMIAYQEKHYNGEGIPVDNIRKDEIPLGARLLKVAIDYDLLITRNLSPKNSLLKMIKRKGRYDPKVMRAFIELLQFEDQFTFQKIKLNELLPYMIAGEEIYSLNGMLLLQKGNEFTLNQIERLKNLDKTHGVKQPISVLIPPEALRRKKEKHDIEQ